MRNIRFFDYCAGMGADLPLREDMSLSAGAKSIKQRNWHTELYTIQKENFFIMMQEHLIQAIYPILTSLLEESRANPGLRQVGAKASTMNAGSYSLTTPGFLKPGSLHFSLLKTYPDSLRLTPANRTAKSSATFMNWGIMQNGNATPLRQIIGGSQGNRVYDNSGAACTQMSQGGTKTGMYFIDMNPLPNITKIARCILTRHDGGIGKHKGERSVKNLVPTHVSIRRKKMFGKAEESAKTNPLLFALPHKTDMV